MFPLPWFEVRACLVGVKMPCSLGFHYLILEGDSASSISWMTYGEHGPWRLAHCVKEAFFSGLFNEHLAPMDPKSGKFYGG